MKKKVISIAALTLVCAMTAASLAGCGTQAEATGQELENGETIVVTESSIPSGSEDEITSTEVIGGTEADAEAFAGAENEDIVLYAEIGKSQYVGQENATFESLDVTFVAREEIPLFNGRGVEVGYIRNGGSVNVTEGVVDKDWARFENPIAEADYDYLYLMKSCIPDENAVYVTAEDIKQRIIDFLNSRDYAIPTILDAPTDDMEVEEHRMEREYSDDLEVDYWIYQYFYDSDNSTPLLLGRYMTYYIECQEDGDGIICKVYYKDSIENVSN